MSKTIQVSEQTYKRIQDLAEPFVDTTPESVILKLLTHYEAISHQPGVELSKIANYQIGQRESRQRGIKIKINEKIISAASVSDLYEQVLIFLDEEGYFIQLRALLPIPTSRSRYLAATKPEHPKGNDFVVAVKHNGIYMEAHKDYTNGINHLGKMLGMLGLTLEIQE